MSHFDKTQFGSNNCVVVVIAVKYLGSYYLKVFIATSSL